MVEASVSKVQIQSVMKLTSYNVKSTQQIKKILTYSLHFSKLHQT